MINSSSDNKFNFEKQAVLWLAMECWVKGARVFREALDERGLSHAPVIKIE